MGGEHTSKGKEDDFQEKQLIKLYKPVNYWKSSV